MPVHDRVLQDPVKCLWVLILSLRLKKKGSELTKLNLTSCTSSGTGLLPLYWNLAFLVQLDLHSLAESSDSDADMSIAVSSLNAAHLRVWRLRESPLAKFRPQPIQQLGGMRECSKKLQVQKWKQINTLRLVKDDHDVILRVQDAFPRYSYKTVSPPKKMLSFPQFLILRLSHKSFQMPSHISVSSSAASTSSSGTLSDFVPVKEEPKTRHESLKRRAPNPNGSKDSDCVEIPEYQAKKYVY